MYELLNGIKHPEDIRELSDMQQRILAREIRHFLIESVSKTGGHLASNLGIVELTIALHSVYSSPRDKIIWDVGHQSYVHKLLTGRADKFSGLRQYGGISGFPKIDESPHDVFGTGHSSTSISAALGIAAARDMHNDNYSVVAVIGDGALTGGMAFEALNHAGHLKSNITVVLNENEMSIAHNVGSLSGYLSRLRTDPKYFRVKEDIEHLLKRIPGIGRSMAKVAEKAKDSIKYFLVPSMFFEEMGFTYLGPIDGHNITILKDVLKRSKTVEGPVLIHVVTQKGRGYKPALDDPGRFHGVGPFDVNTGRPLEGNGRQSFSSAFGEAMVELAAKDSKIVAITAAMADGTGLDRFSKQYPDRFFDVGIAEQHAVTFAAGLAKAGFKPVFAVYSTFLQRAYDQLIHDVCLQKLPVVLAIDRAGIVGNDGPTHHGIFDISYLRHIPNIQVLAPCNCNELKQMLEYALNANGPVAIRYPRGADEVTAFGRGMRDRIKQGKSQVIMEGKGLCILAVGNMVHRAYRIAQRMKMKGIDTGVVNVRFIKPMDRDLLEGILKKTSRIAVIEDNVISGGFGSSVLELCSMAGIKADVKLFGFPDEFIPHGDTECLFHEYGLDEEALFAELLRFVGGGRAIGF